MQWNETALYDIIAQWTGNETSKHNAGISPGFILVYSYGWVSLLNRGHKNKCIKSGFQP